MRSSPMPEKGRRAQVTAAAALKEQISSAGLERGILSKATMSESPWCPPQSAGPRS